MPHCHMSVTWSPLLSLFAPSATPGRCPGRSLVNSPWSVAVCPPGAGTRRAVRKHLCGERTAPWALSSGAQSLCLWQRNGWLLPRRPRCRHDSVANTRKLTWLCAQRRDITSSLKCYIHRTLSISTCYSHSCSTTIWQSECRPHLKIGIADVSTCVCVL